MPPKKKQEQIDLSTLPECVSSNAIILCKGKKQRSDKIINKIMADYKSFISKITRQQVMDHAKQKNIYVDPNTLNDKQKKDPKFMESVCTELSPEIVAKATKSFIEQLSVKVRLELKAQNEKPQQQRPQQVLQMKMDQLFVLSPQFFQSRQQYEALAEAKQGVKYILVINPAINWSNAPEAPEAQEDDQAQQEDDQMKQLRQLKIKQQLNNQDTDHNSSINLNIKQITQYRRESNLSSTFRDCIIDFVDSDIDPYNQDQSIGDLVKNFIGRLSKLSGEYDEFLEWKKDKVKEAIVPQQNQTVQNNVISQQAESADNKVKAHRKAKGTTAIQILSNFVDGLFSHATANQEQDQDIQGLINCFDFDKPRIDIVSEQSRPGRKDIKSSFYSQNENLAKQIDNKNTEQQIRSKLKYPGLNRYLMPDIPFKSAPLRKLNQSQYVQFLNEDLPYEQFQRRLSLVKFEEILKQVDQERKYDLNDRIYQENHDQKSLVRQLYRAMSQNQQAHFLTKYNEQNDKLYLALLYKNNQRRNHSKVWESQWKVLPNYESWLKYFKENESNSNSQSFYDIDYEKIGHINDKVRAFSIPDGGVLINKKATIANTKNEFLYGIKNHHLFGIDQGVFYSQNKSTKIHHFSSGNNQFQTQILIGQNLKLRLQLSTGDVVLQAQGESRRTYTPDGYTIINQSSSSNEYKILHPTGGVSSSDSYINQRGLGMKDGQRYSVPTLLRRTDSYQIIKRDDNTVIVKDQQKKWIKFLEGTEYLVINNEISIQKKNMPFVKCSNGVIHVEINDLTIRGEPNSANGYTFNIHYNDGNHLKLQNSQIQITQMLSDIPYVADILTNKFQIQFGQQRLTIGKDQTQYFKNGVEYNPTQNQENFSENQTIPQDYLEPKLFIISPDNTGVEYLSAKQLEYYFSLKSDQKNNTISSISSSKHTTNVHITSRIVQLSELNPKRINLNLNIDLDIFKFEKYFKQKTLAERFTVRSLIKHKNLLPQDQLEVEEVKDKKQEWFKKARKEENQFGHKTKADPIVEQISRDKKIMIDFRKKQLPTVNFQQLKSQAISQWKFKEKQHMTMVAQKQEQDKIRMRLSKRKKSLVQNYLPIVVKPKQQSQETDTYSPAGFYTHYFQTNQGRKALAAMPEWVFRPKTAKVEKQLDPDIVTQLNNTMNKTKKQERDFQDEQKQRYDTVDVNLNPVRQIYIKPSVFTQREIDQQRQAFQHQKKAYFYHEKKRKEFDIYGGDRRDKVQVKSLLRTQPISQINQKYLITQAPLDKKIKISSMKNKLTSQASSLVEMRKEGPHHTLLKTLDKRNDYNTLLQKRTMMVHADLNDKLQRDILITPVEAEFGYLKEGRSYELKINVKNEDILAQRLVVKKSRNINIKVVMSQMGPIALGMSRKIIVQIKAASQFLGRFTDQFEIVSKHQIYKIPITAHILTQSQFQNEGVKLSSNIRQIQELLKRKVSELPPIN